MKTVGRIMVDLLIYMGLFIGFAVLMLALFPQLGLWLEHLGG